MFSIHICGMDGRGWGSGAGLGAMVVAGLVSIAIGFVYEMGK